MNKKNKADHKNNYLSKKLEKAEAEHTSNAASAVVSLQRQIKPALPIEVIVAEYGIKPAVIIQYLVSQINHPRQNS